MHVIDAQPALRTATRNGADIAVQSTHKTLAGLTQAAMLHASGPLVCRTRIAAALRTLQASLIDASYCTAAESCSAGVLNKASGQNRHVPGSQHLLSGQHDGCRKHLYLSQHAHSTLDAPQCTFCHGYVTARARDSDSQR